MRLSILLVSFALSSTPLLAEPGLPDEALVHAALSDHPSVVAARAKLVARYFGGMTGTGLKNFVYATFPEITNMRWGDPITI